MPYAVKKCLTQKRFFCSIETAKSDMRVTGGIGRGQRLKVPTGAGVRPTSDKVKQALFNIFGDRVVDASFLDLYAGAGGIGIEALSREAGSAVFVDSSRESLSIIKKNMEHMGFK